MAHDEASTTDIDRQGSCTAERIEYEDTYLG